MHYSDYNYSRDLAMEILLDCRVTQLPVITSELCKELGIVFHLYEPADENDGISFIAGGVPHILVSARTSPARQRFTAAHEMGHILLGHVGEYQSANRGPSGAENPIEAQANVFASRLLAPACVLWGCGVRSARDIMTLCSISRTAAEYRMAHMKRLFNQGIIFSAPLERMVYYQFLDFIRKIRGNTL